MGDTTYTFNMFKQDLLKLLILQYFRTKPDNELMYISGMFGELFNTLQPRFPYCEADVHKALLDLIERGYIDAKNGVLTCKPTGLLTHDELFVFFRKDPQEEASTQEPS